MLCRFEAFTALGPQYQLRSSFSQVQSDTASSISTLSPALQVEVIMEVQRKFFEKVPPIRHDPPHAYF